MQIRASVHPISTLATVAVAWLCVATAGDAQTLSGTLLVANRVDVAGSISLFDLPTGTEIARIPVGPGWPHEIAVSPDGRLALVAEYGLDAPGEQVLVIDIREARAVAAIPTGPGSKPHDSAFLPGGRHALVTLETSDELALIDVVSRSVLRRYPIGTGAREGHMFMLGPDGRAYVGGRISGTVSIVSLEAGVPPTVIRTGAGAEAIAITPRGDIWVLNQDANTVSVIDPGTSTVVDTFDSARQPRRIASVPGNRMAVINGNAQTAGLRIYDATTRALLDEIGVPGKRVAADGFGMLAVDRSLFVSTRVDGRILLYDLDRPRTGPTLFATGHDTPDGMAWSPLRVEVLANDRKATP